MTTRPELSGTFGMAASTHWLASAVAMGILERGGNAFDAAVAGGFTLQVVEPHLNGPGGEVPILLYSARSGDVEVVCGQGSAPQAATIEAFRALGLDLVPGTGLLAAVVPGAFGGWLRLLRDYGSMEFADLVAPAIHYAEGGCPLVAPACRTIAAARDLFEREWPTSAAVYLAAGVPEPGSLFRNPALARTYRRLVWEAKGGTSREGRIERACEAWYRGFVAEAIDRFCRETEALDVSGRRHRGLLGGDDMARWSARVEAPLRYDYHGYTLCKTGPWGQGPVALQQLALLSGFDLDSLSADEPDFVHIVTECAKLAFADREAFYGDPDFVEVPMERLLSDSYNRERRTLVSGTASTELRPGEVPGFGAAPVLRRSGPPSVDGVADGAGEPTVASLSEPSVGGDTCHIDVVDRWGNMVSATPSGGWLQSSPAIPDLGFPLNTRAQMFWLKEGHPASLAPGKRPRTTLTPSLALRDGAPYLAFGTPGGDQQDQWSLNMFLRHVHFGLDLQRAIEAPEFHSAHFPSSFYPRRAHPGRLHVEARFSEATRDELRRHGHELVVEEAWSLGRVSAVARDGDSLKSGANPRGMQGYAVGR